MRAQKAYPRQPAKYEALMRRIADAKASGRDYILEGAKEISLFVHDTEELWRQVCRTSDLPIERRKSGLRMKVSLYYEDLALRDECARFGLDYEAERRRRHASFRSAGSTIPNEGDAR